MNKVYQLFRITSLITGLTRHKHTIKETNFIILFSFNLATVSRSNLFSFCPCCLFYFFILACFFPLFFLGFWWQLYFFFGFFFSPCSVPFTFAFFHHDGFLVDQSSEWAFIFICLSMLASKAQSHSVLGKHFFLVSSLSLNQTFIFGFWFSSDLKRDILS